MIFYQIFKEIIFDLLILPNLIQIKSSAVYQKFKVCEKLIKTYFSTHNSIIFSSPFISSPQIFNSFTTTPQIYQYHPIHYSSTNILAQPLTNAKYNNVIIDKNKEVKSLLIISNLNNYCSYCLPTNTSLVSFDTSHQPLPRQRPEALITGSKIVELKSLYVDREKNLNNLIKLRSINRSYKESVADIIESSSVIQSENFFRKTIMVRNQLI